MPGDAKASAPALRVEEARRLREALERGAVDAVSAATEARAIFGDAGNEIHARWLDHELAGYAALSDVHPLHEVLGLPSGDRLGAQIAAYRRQVGRRFAGAVGEDRFVHFFVEPLAALISARDEIHAIRTRNGLIELSFGPPTAPGYPQAAEFPADVFDRILRGFTALLQQELGELS
jgi:hypothetical protein